jgi:hypothetical protein
MNRDLFESVADLSVPFAFLLGAQGVKYLDEKRKQKSHQHGGDPGFCFLCEQQAGGAAARAALREEISKITEDLKQLLAEY